MQAIHHLSIYSSLLRSSTPLPADSRRVRISSRLFCICDNIFIPDLGYNGTILDIKGRFVIVLPHDYGPSIRRLPRNLRYGIGISTHIRRWFNQIDVAYNDNTILLQGTFPNLRKGKYNINEICFNLLFWLDLNSPTSLLLNIGRRPVFDDY